MPAVRAVLPDVIVNAVVVAVANAGVVACKFAVVFDAGLSIGNGVVAKAVLKVMVATVPCAAGDVPVVTAISPEASVPCITTEAPEPAPEPITAVGITDVRLRRFVEVVEEPAVLLPRS